MLSVFTLAGFTKLGGFLATHLAMRLLQFLSTVNASAPSRDSAIPISSRFPGGVILIFLGVFYFIAALALAIRLYRHRSLSHMHSIAFHASLGILALCTTLIWRAV